MSGVGSDAALHRKLSSHEPPLLTTVHISTGNRVTLTVTFEADEKHIDGSWWVVAQAIDVLSSALDFYGFCPFRSFEVGFASARTMLAAQKARDRKGAYDRLIHAPLPE
jgi:hypothetical protein